MPHTLKDNLANAAGSVFCILKDWRYLVAAIAAALAVGAAGLLVANSTSIGFILRSGIFSPEDKFEMVFRSLFSTIGTFGPFHAAVNASISALFGINLAVTAFFIKKKVAFQRSLGLGFAAIAVSLLGVGCAACGSVVLFSVLGTGAAAALIAALPFKGLEFGLAGIVILLFSIYYTARRVAAPVACGIGNRGGKGIDPKPSS